MLDLNSLIHDGIAQPGLPDRAIDLLIEEENTKQRNKKIVGYIWVLFFVMCQLVIWKILTGIHGNNLNLIAYPNLENALQNVLLCVCIVAILVAFRLNKKHRIGIIAFLIWVGLTIEVFPLAFALHKLNITIKPIIEIMEVFR